MPTLYYNKDNMGVYTNNKHLAELKVENGEWSDYESTEEEIIMQGDGSGYVLKSAYVEDISNLVSEKIAELKAKRDTLEVEDIVTPYGTFDYDDKARERINAAIIALDAAGVDASITWTLADQSDVTVTSAMLRNVVALVAQRSDALHTKYRGYHDKVDAIVASDDTNKVEQIKAVVWED